ncbi:MAG: M15 family metallopeptidase [Polyangiaceae bacterium]
MVFNPNNNAGALAGAGNGGAARVLGAAAAQETFHFSETDRSIARDRADLARYAERKGVVSPGPAFTQRLGGPLPAPARGPAGTMLPRSTALADWRRRNIATVDIPQLRGRRHTAAADPYLARTHTPEEYAAWQRQQVSQRLGTTVEFNSRCTRQLQALWNAWDRAGLLSLVIFEIGFLLQRYKRGSGNTSISNHAYGTAFDINSVPNSYRAIPAPRGAWGTVVPLVPLAIDHGFYWGGFYNDGMHFEVGKVIP